MKEAGNRTLEHFKNGGGQSSFYQREQILGALNRLLIKLTCYLQGGLEMGPDRLPAGGSKELFLLARLPINFKDSKMIVFQCKALIGFPIF